MKSKWSDLTLHLELKYKSKINNCKEFMLQLFTVLLFIGVTFILSVVSYLLNKPYLTYVQTLEFSTLGNLELKFILWTLVIAPIDIVLFACNIFLIYCIVALLVVTFSSNKE